MPQPCVLSNSNSLIKGGSLALVGFYIQAEIYKVTFSPNLK